MKITILACLFIVSLHASAQDTDIVPQGNKTDTLTSVDVEAKFPGGIDAWRTFLVEHVHVTVAANHKAPPGNYTVEVSFMVDTTGKVTNVKIDQDPGYGTADDVLKLFKHSPNWIPAMQNGKKVIYRQKQRIMYQVTEK